MVDDLAGLGPVQFLTGPALQILIVGAQPLEVLPQLRVGELLLESDPFELPLLGMQPLQIDHATIAVNRAEHQRGEKQHAGDQNDFVFSGCRW